MLQMDSHQPVAHALITTICGVLLVLSAVGLARAQPASFPQQFSATFVLNARNVDIGSTQWELKPLGNGGYAFSTHSEAIGIAKLFRDERIGERSEWQFADGQVRPLRYFYSRAGGKRDREVQIDFDWDKALVRNTLNGKSWTMPLVDGTLDKLVYVLAMMNDLAEGMREIRYPVADGGKTKAYRIKVVGEAQLDTVVGPLETIVVERSQEGKSRLTRIWCARALGFFPVQIKHFEDEETVQFTLTALEGLSVK